MPICIHCATPIESLYMRYGKDHIVLSPCSSRICSPSSGSLEAPRIADEYLEHDLTVVIIDLILAKPKAYRHLLYNRSSILAAPKPELRPNKTRGRIMKVAKRWLALALVDAYIRWFYLCVQPPESGRVEREARWSSRAAEWIHSAMPLQAGVFFPSLFTPAIGNSQTLQSDAVQKVCRASPFWLPLALLSQPTDPILPTLVSYTNVLLITLIESLALHTTAVFITHIAIRNLQPKSKTKPSAQDPLLACKALLLSQLSPLILLTLVLLWSTKFPHSHTPSTTTTPAHDRGALIWLIRTFLTSLNAGVAIATVLPTKPQHAFNPWPPLILTAAWSAQTLASYTLYTALS